MTTINDRRPNFRGEDGNLFLVRCYNCDPHKGRENYIAAAATGKCAWCGWDESSNKPVDKRPKWRINYEKCVALLQQHPDWDYAELGKELGISRQYVRNCFAKAGAIR